MIVADSNLIAYLAFGGPNEAVARAVMAKDADWRVPSLWLSEFRNILVTHCRAKRLSWEEAQALCRVMELRFSVGAVPVSTSDVLRLAERHRLTAYDAEYVALAEALDCPLVTWDSGILERCPQRAASAAAFVGPSAAQP